MSNQVTITRRIGLARSFLFTPGSRPERFEKAARSGADAIVLDLEDGVPPAEKAGARDAIAREWDRVKALGTPVVVRLNALSTPFGEDDLAWAKRLFQPAAIMLPKAETAEPIATVHAALPDIPILPLVESVAGYFGLAAVAAAPGVARLMLGHIDFMVDSGLQCGEDESEVAPLRFAIAMATRANRLAAPVDGVTVQIADLERLRVDTQRGLRFGFGGKMCIHPSQVAVIHEAFAPTEKEQEWARKVLAADAASGGAAVQVDGRLIDLPIVLQAHRTLARVDGALVSSP